MQIRHTRYILFLLALWPLLFAAQVRNKTDSNKIAEQDTLVIDTGKKDSVKIFRPTIQDYQFFTENGVRSYIDTVFTVDKLYRYTNYTNRDTFGLLPFANIGAGFNPVEYQFNPEQNLTLLPINKSYLIIPRYRVRYYDVKTPTTTFMYHNAMRNGAALTTTYTQNIGKRINLTAEYMGLRSQGFYRRGLTANNHTLFSGHYLSKNGHYEVFAHYLHQNINAEENGGILRDDLYLAKDKSFRNKQNVQINLANSHSRFSYRRYYLSQYFTPFDAERFPLRLHHEIYHQGNKYSFSQTAPEEYYLKNTTVNEAYASPSYKYSDNLSNTLSALWQREKFTLSGGFRHQRIELGTDASVINGIPVGSGLRENRVGLVASLDTKIIPALALDADFEASRGGTFGTFLRSANRLDVTIAQQYHLLGEVNFQSAVPSFNYHLNPSIYQAFNYFRTDFDNENLFEIKASAMLPWWGIRAFTHLAKIGNMAYFDSNGQPMQSSEGVNVLKIGGAWAAGWRKFHGDFLVQYQGVPRAQDLLPLPQILARANVYYQSKVFQNHAEIMTGLKGVFYSRFDSRRFFPVLNEFVLAGNQGFAIGNTPMVDAYFSIKVKRMFIFLEGQNLLSTLNIPMYAAPSYPVPDFRLNMGLVWYLLN